MSTLGGHETAIPMDSVSAIPGAQVQNLRPPPAQPVEVLIVRPIEQPADSGNARAENNAKQQQEQRRQLAQQQLTSNRRNLNILLDKASGRVVFQSIDPENGEVKNQVPTEQILRLAASLRSDRGTTGIFVDNRA